MHSCGIGVITSNFDARTGVNCESAYHTTRSEEKDFSALLQQLNHSEVFRMKKSRKHNSFPKIKQNLMKKLCERFGKMDGTSVAE